MPVRVPFHLLRRDDSRSAAALLLESDDPAELLSIGARVADPAIFHVAGGFLIVAEGATLSANAIRLRRLSENCYIPTDSELVPSLLPAEVVDLTRNRGLVFRPGRSALAFDPTRSLRPAAFLRIIKPARNDWTPFPEGDRLAERLTMLTRIVPEPPIDEMLAGDGPGIGTDDVRPPQAGAGKRALGKMSVGLGAGLGAIGRAIGSKGLGALGKKLKDAGTSMSPRITEDLLGKQEAALQHLLKRFREGNTDDALRRAIPVGGEPGRGGKIYGSADLPSRGLGWSFGGLFGSDGRSAIWAGGNPDTWRDLVAEYHKAAREAADRGDFRRAALIYAKLLNDFRSAAEVLSKGGLHREAAILFRDKLRQLDHAGREFEKAGENDEALRLYRESDMNIEAGDLLRRLGEEELAIEEYHRAADRIVRLRREHVEAGDILLRKTGCADLAIPYFVQGWDDRLQSANPRNAIGCAERLIDIHALAESREPFWALLTEAEDWLREPGWSHDAGRFFNKVVECAELPHLRSDRAEIRDRCRLGLATKLRQFGKSEQAVGTAVSDLFGTARRWSPALMSDADYAIRAAIRQRPKDELPAPRRSAILSLHTGTVTAAVQAPESGQLFVGFDDGTVRSFDPNSGDARNLPAKAESKVVGLATNSNGESLVTMGRLQFETQQDRFTVFPMTFWTRSGSSYHARSLQNLEAESDFICGLLPLFESSTFCVGVSTTVGVTWYRLPELVPVIETGPSVPSAPTTYLKLRIPEPAGGDSPLTFQGGSISWAGKKAYIGWMPDPAPASTLFTPQVAWLVASAVHVEVAGLFDNETLYWSAITRNPDGLRNTTLTFRVVEGFRAVATWRPGHVIGVSANNRIHWLRARSGRFEQWAPTTDLGIASRVAACFPSRRTNEIMIVFEDGTLARMAVPG